MKTYALRELKIELTHYCPLACVHCSSNASLENAEIISQKKCFQILQEAYSLGVSDIAFSGGEPLTWPDLEAAVAFCTQHKMQTTIYTSGNVDGIDTKMQALAFSGLKRVIFSLYSADEDSHNLVTRRKNSYNNTLIAIKAAKKYSIQTELHFVALRNNYRQLEKVALLASAYGVDQISVLRFVPQGRGRIYRKQGELNHKEAIELRETIIKLRQEQIKIRTGSPWNVLQVNEEPACKAAENQLIISPNLRIYPCDAFKQIEYEKIAPNDEYSSLESHSLVECWQNSAYLQTIRQHKECGHDLYCQKCVDYSRCHGGCIAQKYIRYGQLDDKPDPMCIKGVNR